MIRFLASPKIRYALLGAVAVEAALLAYLRL